ESLLMAAAQQGRADWARVVTSAALHRGGQAAEALLRAVEDSLSALPGEYSPVASALLALKQLLAMLRPGKLYHVSDAEGTADLEERSRTGREWLSAYIAWLMFLCRHPRTAEIFRIQLRDWLFQAVVRAGWSDAARRLALRFRFLKIGGSRLSPVAYIATATA